jgi:hypothetical protein
LFQAKAVQYLRWKWKKLKVLLEKFKFWEAKNNFSLKLFTFEVYQIFIYKDINEKFLITLSNGMVTIEDLI